MSFLTSSQHNLLTIMSEMTSLKTFIVVIGSIYQNGLHSKDVSSYWEWEFHKEVSLRSSVINKNFFTISFDKLIMYTWISPKVDFFLLCFIYTFSQEIFLLFQISPRTSIPWSKLMETVMLRPYAMLNTGLLELSGTWERQHTDLLVKTDFVILSIS